MPDMGVPLGTVLIAGDEETREFLGHLLRSQGYRVLAARDNSETMDLIRTEPVDLALLDVLMPRAGGFSVCRQLKSQADTRFLPVVLVTGLGRADDRIRGIESGADDFLSKPLRKEELLARVKSLIRMKRCTDELDNAETVLYTLATSIEAKDPYTEGHCDRLVRYSVALATQLGLSEEQRTALRRAGIVHDIGKVVVPEQILLKAGPLDAGERALMEQHTLMGEHICAPLKLFRQVLPIIRWHHERRDGSGYPDRLKGDAIPLTAQVLQTVDVYDALTIDRPYRKALPHQAALATMREEVRRGWWDGALVDALETTLKNSPMLVAAPGSAAPPLKAGAGQGDRRYALLQSA
jgi:putative two-component system response regulator